MALLWHDEARGYIRHTDASRLGVWVRVRSSRSRTSHTKHLAGEIVPSRQSGFAKVLYSNGLTRSATDSEEQKNAILARLSESPGHRQYLVGIYQGFIQNANGEKCWHIRKCPRKTTPYRISSEA